MLPYYLDLARRSFARHIGLTILMVVAIGFGIGASMTTLTVLRVLSSDPIPEASARLFHVQLQPQDLGGYLPGTPPPTQVTRRDAEALLRARRADRQAMMTGGSTAIESGRPDLPPFYADARYTSADFFAMFRVPFIAGGGWSAEDDQRAARVVVIARALAEKVFGTTQAVGRVLRVEGTEMQIIGVIDTWRPSPLFYDVTRAHYGDAELVFVPFATSRELRLSHSGSTDCWGDANGDQEAVGAPCVWIQFWVELDSADKVAAYRDFLISYSQQELAAGRYQRPPDVRLRDVLAWLTDREVVPNDVRLQTWVALAFLLVCLINTIGLLLTKFLRRSSEIGVRRALGASKQSIFVQLLVEAGMIGLAGGVLGLGLAVLGLVAVRHQPVGYAELAHLDLPMLVATFGLALVASVLAGVLPAWRGCQVPPAIQLKSH